MQSFTFSDIQLYTMVQVVVIVEDKYGNILLQKSGIAQIKNKWVLPSGYVHITDDNLEDAARRCVKEQLRMDIVLTELVEIVGNPDAHLLADKKYVSAQVVYRAKLADGAHVDVPTATVKYARFVKPVYALFFSMGLNHKKLIYHYLQKIKKNEMVPVVRREYSEHFGEEYLYEEKNYMHAVVMGIVLNEKNEILLGHRAQRPYKDYWDFPGGHMYVHESLKQCLRREVGEELGVSCQVGNLFHVYSDKGMSPRFARAMVLYFITLDSDRFIKNVELDDFQYFALDKLPSNIAFHCEGALADIQDYIQKKST